MLQKVFETNFDEELVHFQKVLKWEKVDLNINIESSHAEIEQCQVKMEEEVKGSSGENEVEDPIYELKKSVSSWDLPRRAVTKVERTLDQSTFFNFRD